MLCFGGAPSKATNVTLSYCALKVLECPGVVTLSDIQWLCLTFHFIAVHFRHSPPTTIYLKLAPLTPGPPFETGHIATKHM